MPTPRRAESQRRVAATWAIASTAGADDRLATAQFLATPEVLADFRFEYVGTDAEDRAERLRDFAGELFSG